MFRGTATPAVAVWVALATTQAMYNPHQLIGELIIDKTAVDAVRICGKLVMAAVTMEQMVTPTVVPLMASVISIHGSKRLCLYTNGGLEGACISRLFWLQQDYIYQISQ